MGLDIIAYSDLRPAPEAPDVSRWTLDDWDRYVNLYDRWKTQFPGRMEGIAEGVYTFTGRFSFQAGSYSGYGAWRDELARLAGYENAKAVWAAFERNTSFQGPFVELIQFADNEGVIGPMVAEKLARDFAEYADKMAAGTWFAQRYALWRKAFELAAEDGAVVFR